MRIRISSRCLVSTRLTVILPTNHRSPLPSPFLWTEDIRQPFGAGVAVDAPLMTLAAGWSCVAAFLKDRALSALAATARGLRSIVDEEYRRRLAKDFGSRVYKLHGKYRARGMLGPGSGLSFRWSYMALRRLCLSQRSYLSIAAEGFESDTRWVELDASGMRLRVFSQAGADRVQESPHLSANFAVAFRFAFSLRKPALYSV